MIVTFRLSLNKIKKVQKLKTHEFQGNPCVLYIYNGYILRQSFLKHVIHVL